MLATAPARRRDNAPPMAEPAPAPWHPLRQQCAGTKHAPLLSNGGGVVLKPLQAGDRGAREVALYQLLRSQGSAAPLGPPLTAAYHGVRERGGAGGAAPAPTRYLALENALAGMAAPCVADFKVGRRTYEEGADEAKKARAQAKYRHQEEVGWRLAGLVAEPAGGGGGGGERRVLGKGWGRELAPAEVGRCFEELLPPAGSAARSAVGGVLARQLQALIGALGEQAISTVSSSVLMAYDAAAEPDAAAAGARLLLIDFAHWAPLEDGAAADENTLYGMRSLLATLQLSLE